MSFKGGIPTLWMGTFLIAANNHKNYDYIRGLCEPNFSYGSMIYSAAA
jgi:hypothetical protein